MFYIDPSVEHVGVSRLRQLNSRSLSKLDKLMVILGATGPLAVVIDYEKYIALQERLRELEAK